MKKTLITIALLGISTVTFAQSNSNLKENKKESTTNPVKGEMFDNSLPGLWELEMKTTSKTNPELNGVKKAKNCVTKEDIEKSRQMTLIERFNADGGLQCKSNFNKNTKNRATFTMDCNGVDKDSAQPVNMNIAGFVVSLPKFSEMVMNYKISSPNKPVMDLKMDTKSRLVAEVCEKN